MRVKSGIAVLATAGLAVVSIGAPIAGAKTIKRSVSYTVRVPYNAKRPKGTHCVDGVHHKSKVCTKQIKIKIVMPTHKDAGVAPPECHYCRWHLVHQRVEHGRSGDRSRWCQRL